ncbi:MAG: RluA family pseudouridine synthase [Proteobacteria bacterium]|nr:RluA family pseudouridine synthase [Pseudomonadota bacterium]MBU1686889.1 RluA family pseudouridine synthase [Pseudomonadota bacterium]
MDEMEPQIIYHDDSVVVVEKPGGLLAVPGRGPDKQDCVVNRIKAKFPQMIDQPAVHRLDMATSGLMVLAVTQQAHRQLSKDFAARKVTKRYLAVLAGLIAEDSGRIELAFRLNPDNRPHQVYDPVHGKIGISLWRNLGAENGRTRVEFAPLTGRTHQLRLHAVHPLGLGCPIIGDPLYGNGKEGDRLLLHASFLEFQHPQDGHPMTFTSPPPF